MANTCFSDLAECFTAFTIEPECDFPPFLTVSRCGLGNMVAAQISFLFYQQTFFDWLSTLRLLLVSFDPVFWRNYFLPRIDCTQALAAVGIHYTELELGYA